MKFIDPHKNLGNTRVGKEHTITFNHSPTITVTQIKLSCGCTSDKVDDKNKCIIIKYKAKPIPDHLILEGKVDYLTTKTIEVKYTDTDAPGLELVETLTFKAHVYKS